MLEPFQLPFVQRGLLEVGLLSIGAGVLGVWIVLRGLAFYAHAVGAAAFPGLVLADGLGFAAPLGAFGAALLFAGSLERLSQRRRGDYDSMTALVLAGALALGIVLASDVFHSGSNLETLLFGSLLTIDGGDVALAAVASGVTLVANVALGRHWLASGFDDAALRSMGVRSAASEAVLLILIALVAVAALAAVGALLTTALLVIPAATVRLWIRRISVWQIATVALTAVEGAGGLWLAVKTNAPPGATIAVLAGSTFALAALARTIRDRHLGRQVALVAAAAGAAIALGACAGKTTDQQAKLNVVATTTQIADWVRQVGGSGVDVHQILQPNSDPHMYELRPADVQAAANAKIVFVNGDTLDRWAGKMIQESGSRPAVVELGAGTPFKLPGESAGSQASRYDPHWWHDPRNTAAAVRAIRDSLGSAAPNRKRTFAGNAKAYLAKLRALDRGIARCIAKIPPRKRKLVTDHDAFDYFARRYGIEIIGAVIPSQTTQAQPSAKDLARLTKLIEREKVDAIFPEASINRKLADSIARQTGARSNLTLYGDTLGPRGSSGDTYLKMESANADAIARGLSGGKVNCTVKVHR